jgi:hypothetical protein
MSLEQLALTMIAKGFRFTATWTGELCTVTVRRGTWKSHTSSMSLPVAFSNAVSDASKKLLP